MCINPKLPKNSFATNSSQLGVIPLSLNHTASLKHAKLSFLQLLYLGILILPTLLYLIAVLGFNFDISYNSWLCCRMIYVFWMIPITVELASLRQESPFLWPLHWLLVTLPMTVLTSLLAGPNLIFILLPEIYLSCAFWLVTRQQLSLAKSHYIAITTLLFTFPGFVYYLYLDIWNQAYPYVWLMSPLGWFVAPKNAALCCIFGTLLFYIFPVKNN